MTRRTFLPLVSAAFLPSCEKKSGPKPLVVGMDISYPPFEFYDEKGKPDGVDVRIAEALAKYLGRELKLENTGFDALLLAVPSGEGVSFCPTIGGNPVVGSVLYCCM